MIATSLTPETDQITKTSSEEAANMLAKTLARAKKFVAPAILIVEFPSFALKEKTEAQIAKLLENDDELISIDLRQDIDIINEIKALNKNQIGSIVGLHAQPEVVTRLNWAREVLTDNKKRLIFWLNPLERHDLVARAPDFWAFRNRHLVLGIAAASGAGIVAGVLGAVSGGVSGGVSGAEIVVDESYIYYNSPLELSRLSANAKQDRIEALEELLAGVINQESERAQEIRRNLGQLYFEVGDSKNAIKYYEKALVASQTQKDKHGELVDLGNLGNVYRSVGNIDKAIMHYEKTILLARELRDLPSEEAGLGNLGNAFHMISQIFKAIEYYEQALSIAKKIKDYVGEGVALGNLGLAYYSLREQDKAIGYFEDALKIAEKYQDKKSEGNQLGNLGLAYKAKGDVTQALAFFQKALDSSRTIGDRRGEAKDLFNLGLSYMGLGEIEKAKSFLQQSYDVFVAIQSLESNRVKELLDNLS